VAAIRTCVAKGWMPKEALATAAYLETVTRWYSIMSARTMSEGLWKEDQTGRSQAKLQFLREELIPLVQQLKPMNSSKNWLPAMSSILICTEALLTLYDTYVTNGEGINFSLTFISNIGIQQRCVTF